MAGKIGPVCDQTCDEAGRQTNNEATLAEQVVRRTCQALALTDPDNGIVSAQPQPPHKHPAAGALKHPRGSYCEAQQSTARQQGSGASTTVRPPQKKTRRATKTKPNKRVSIQMPSSSAPPPTAKASNLTRIVKPDETGSTSIHSQSPIAPDSSALPLVDVPTPLNTDVLCGRGGAALRHPGNTAYRRLVTLNKGLYATCLKAEKLRISRSIVVAVREQNGRFLERDLKKGTWFDIGDRKATEKTSQALREGQPSLRKKIVELGGEAARALGSSTRDLGASAKASATKAAIKVKKECSPSVTDRKKSPSSAKPVGAKMKSLDKPKAQRTRSDGNLESSPKARSHPAPAAPLHPTNPPEPSCTAAHDQHQPHVVHANKVHLHAEQHTERTVAMPPPSAAAPDSASFDLPQPGQTVRQRSFTLQSLVGSSSHGSDGGGSNSGLHHANHPWHDSVNSITSEATQLQGNLTAHGGCGLGHGHGGHHNSSFDDSLSSLGGKLEPGTFRNLAPPSLETIHSVGTVEHEPNLGGPGNSTAAEEGPLKRTSMTGSDHSSGAGDIAVAAVASYNAAAKQGQPQMVPPSNAAWVQQPRQQQRRLSLRTRLRPSIHVRGSAAAHDLGIDDRNFSIASGFSDYGMEELMMCEDNPGGESCRSLALTDASGITAESGGADTSESGTIGDGMGFGSGAATPTSGWDEGSERTGESSSQSSGKAKGTPPMPRAITADGKPLKTAMKVDRRRMFASMKVTHGPAPSRRSASASNLNVPNHDRNNSMLSKDDNYDIGKFQMVQSNQSLHSTFSSMRDLSISDSRPGGGDLENDSIAKSSQDGSSLRSIYASKRSLMSGFSRMSDVTEAQSIFSDLSKKIGNVSTRSIAMSDFSGIDENDDVNVDDLSGLTPAHSQSMECE